MFSFLKQHKKQGTRPVSLSLIESDWHCHVLPGIDDGAKTPEESLSMLQEYVQLGVKKIVATPHVRADFFKNTTQTIQTALAQVQALIDVHHLPVLLEASAEYFADEHFLHLIQTDDLLPIEDQYILFELPMQHPSLLGEKLVESLQRKGFTPVLAHPERYRYWHNKPRDIAAWKDRGVYFQLNLLSLMGHYGQAERRAAEEMINQGYIDAIGTDAHGLRHLQKLEELNQSPYFEALQQLPLLNRLEN